MVTGDASLNMTGVNKLFSCCMLIRQLFVMLVDDILVLSILAVGSSMNPLLRVVLTISQRSLLDLLM